MKKIRVAAYCRVSKGGMEPEHSLQAQITYYTEMIRSDPDYQLVGIYAEIASGLNVKKRTQFQKLLRDCKKRKIDLIYTKSISRFARNTVDFLKAIRQLRKLGVDVFFENEHLYLSRERTETAMSIYAAFMEEESLQKSKSIKWGLKSGFASGNSRLANRVCYGYTHDESGKLIAEPQEAEIVRLIFDLYLGGMSLSGISKELQRRGVPSPTGKETWTPRAIDKLLSNEKYTGNVLLQKTYVPNPFSGKQEENQGKLTQFLYENNHEGIISKELFQAVQAEKQRRAKKNG